MQIVVFIDTRHQSFPFELKAFSQIKIFDIISCPDDLSLKRVVGLHTIASDYTGSVGKGIWTDVASHLDLEPVETFDFDEKHCNGERTGGVLTHFPKQNLFHIRDGVSTSTWLVLDQSRGGFFHRNATDIKMHDIVVSFHDSKYYKVVDYEESTSVDYGGERFDQSFYRIAQVDPRRKILLRNQKFDEMQTIGVGGWASFLSIRATNYYAVLEAKK